MLTSRFAFRVFSAVAIVFALLGAYSVWFFYYSDQAMGRGPYFRRLIGTSVAADDTLVTCTSPGSDVYAFRVSARAVDGLLSRPGALESYPLRAGYQENHTMVHWHSQSWNPDDSLYTFTALTAVSDALRGKCRPMWPELRDAFELAVRDPTSLISYSYMRHGDRVDVLSFFVLDRQMRVLYDVEMAA